jgi:hypothetical protein
MPPKRKSVSKASSSTKSTKKAKAPAVKRGVVSESSDSESSLDDAAFEASLKARAAAMAVVGVAETDVVTSMLFGSSVRALHTVRGAKPARVTMMCSSGHADPLPGGPLGAAVELFAIDDAPQLASLKTGMDLVRSAAHIYEAVANTSELADDLRHMFDTYGSRSFEVFLPDETFQLVGVDRARWTNPDTGRTGVLLTPAVADCIGPTPEFTVDGFEGNIIMACVRFLTAAELQAVIDGGPEARLGIVKRLAEQHGPKQQFCSLTRACVAPLRKADKGKPAKVSKPKPSQANSSASSATADTSRRSTRKSTGEALKLQTLSNNV